jgi:hypothetical protein
MVARVRNLPIAPTIGSGFRIMRALISNRRQVYENNYRGLRNLVFAHKIVSGSLETAKLFSKANVEELQRLLGFLGSLHDALRELFENGRKLELPLPDFDSMAVKERIAREVEEFLVTPSNTPPNDTL